MRHNEIERDIQVPDVSVKVYERSGWQVVDRRPGYEPAVAKGRRRETGEK